MNKLQIIDLGSNKVTDQYISYLGYYPRINKLYLTGTSITSLGILQLLYLKLPFLKDVYWSKKIFIVEDNSEFDDYSEKEEIRKICTERQIENH